MLRDTLVGLLEARLNRTDLNASILAEMLLVQSVHLEGQGTFTPWFLESEMSSASTVIDEERVPLPLDFLCAIEDEPLWLYDTTVTPVWAKLGKTSVGLLTERYTAPGRPLRYAVTDDYLILAPVPNAVFSLKMRYYMRDVEPTTNIENKWLKYAPDLMLAVLGEIMARQYLQNQKLAEGFATDVIAARSRLYIQHEARQHAGRVYQMGED